MKILSTFYSDDGRLTAEVITIPGQSLFVNFLVHNMSIGQIDFQHRKWYSPYYFDYAKAEDVAEDFVNGIIIPKDIRKYIEENK